MPLKDHFRELRNRAILASLAIVSCSVIGWIYYPQIIAAILEPLTSLQRENGEGLVAPNFGGGVTQPFSVQLKVAIFVGIVLSSPLWIWQIWAFLMPGLHAKERRISLAYFAVAAPLFLAGATLAAWSLTRTMQVLLSFTPADGANILDAETYLDFVLYIVVAFGIAFLLPVALVALNHLRILPVRIMLAGWRIALMLILVFAATFTPDPSFWSMFVLAIPMFGLYWLAVGVAAMIERRRRSQEPEWLATPPDEACRL